MGPVMCRKTVLCAGYVRGWNLKRGRVCAQELHFVQLMCQSVRWILLWSMGKLLCTGYVRVMCQNIENPPGPCARRRLGY